MRMRVEEVVKSRYAKTKFREMIDKTSVATYEITKELAEDIRDRAKVLVPVRTGRLRRSIRVLSTTRQGYRATGRVVAGGSSAPYAGHVEARRRFMHNAAREIFMRDVRKIRRRLRKTLGR